MEESTNDLGGMHGRTPIASKLDPTIDPNVSNAFERAGFISLKVSVLWILV